MQLFTIFIISLFLTIALVPVSKHLAFRMNILDIPDARKVHLAPMPKMGGVSMIIGAFIPILLWVPRNNFIHSIIIGSAIIFIFGLIDDIKPLTSIQKIIPQTVAALIVILFGGVKIVGLGSLAPESYIIPDLLSVPLTLLVIIGITNAINLSDGLDGLAGGISMLSFIAIGFLSFWCGNAQIAIMAVAVIGGIAGFLRYNTHPAVLFMGDAGSQLLGFLSIIFALVLTQSNTPYSKILALPLIGFPILDTITVMIERVMKKKSPFTADKNHFHHRLLRFGFFHSEAVLSIYIIQACFICFAIIFRFHSAWVHVLFFVIFSTIILLLFFTARMRKWVFRRDGSFDTVFKKRLRVLKEKKISIRICYGVLRYGLPLIFAVQILIPGKIPVYLSVLAGSFAVLTGAGYYFNWSKYKEYILRFSIFITGTLLLYTAETNPAPWMVNRLMELNTLGFFIIVLFVVLTLNLTQRRKGLKITPMDILVFIVILVLPNLPTTHLQTTGVGVTLAKALILFFCYDVLVGEMRGESVILAKPFIAGLIILAFRGMIV